MDEPLDLPVLTPAVTYLREITLEGKELHDELLYAGFSASQATTIVSHFVLDAVNSREDEDVEVLFEYSDEDSDDEDDDDYGRNSGI